MTLALILALACASPATPPTKPMRPSARRHDVWKHNLDIAREAQERGDLPGAAAALRIAVAEALHYAEADRRTAQTAEAMNALVRHAPMSEEIPAFLEGVDHDARELERAAHSLALAALGALATARFYRYDARGYEQARRELHRRMLIRFGPEHPHTLSSLVAVGDALVSMGRLGEATEIAEQAREIAEQSLGPDAPQALLARRLMGSIRGVSGRYHEAAEIFEEVIEANENAGAGWSELAGYLWMNLSSARSMMGDVRLAEAALTNAHTIMVAVQGPESVDFSIWLQVAAGFHLNRGDAAEALDLSTQAAKIREIRLGPSHLWTLQAVALQGLAQWAAGRTDLALKHAEQVERWLERSDPPEFLEAVTAYHAASMLEARVGRPQAALENATLAINTMERLLGSDAPVLSKYWQQLADARARADHPEAAEAPAEAALSVIERTWGRDHISAASALGTLGRIRSEQGRYSEAAELCGEAASLFEAKLGPNSPWLLEILEQREVALRRDGRPEEAAIAAARAAAIRSRRAEVLAAPKEPSSTIDSSEFNFRVARPGPEWVEVDASRVHPDAKLAFLRREPPASFVLYMYAMRYPTLRKHFDQFLAETPGRVLLRERERVIGGVQGWEFTYTTKKEGKPYHGVRWLGRHGGRVYELAVVALASQSPEDELANSAEKLLSTFSLIDPEAVASSGIRYVSERFGYSVELNEPGWTEWRDAEGPHSTAEFGARYPGADLIVIPVALLGWKPSRAAAMSALIYLVGNKWPEEQREIHVGDLEGIDFEFRPPGQETTQRARARLLLGPHEMYAVLATVQDSLGADADRALAAVEAVRLESGATAHLSAASLSPTERALHANALNSVGFFYANAGQRAEGIEYYAFAHRLDPDDVVILRNLARTELAAGRYADAAAHLEGCAELFPEQVDLVALRALALHRAGDLEAALEEYERAIEAGYEDATTDQNYLEALWSTDRREEARRRLDAIIEKRETLSLRRLRASFSRRSGALEEAIRELEEIEARAPEDRQILSELILSYSEAGRHQSVIDACDRYADSHGVSSELYRQKALAQYALGLYRETKDSLEAALKIEPGSQRTREFLELVSAIMGEGDNRLLGDPLEAVPLPSALVAEADVDPTALEHFGAAYDYWIEAVHFESGAPQRATTWVRGRVADAQGVDAMSGHQFSFDPLWERIYVNELVVRDEAGNVVARGAVPDYYVLDASQDGDFATSEKVLHVPIPGLRAGVVFDLSVTRLDSRPSERFRFTEYLFAGSVPIGVSSLSISGDARYLKHRAHEGVKRRQGDGWVSWSLEDPEPYHWEPMQVAGLTHLPRVMVADGRDDWEQVAREYRRELESFLAPDAEIERIVAELESDSLGENATALEVARFTQKYLRYKALAFGTRTRLPHPVKEIVENRYGDCKDHALMLHQMLSAAGIDADLALVRLAGPIEPSLPSLDQFDHMIVFCEACGGSGLLDVTDKHVPPGVAVPRFLGGRHVLVLDEENPRLLRIPQYQLAKHAVRIEREVEVSAEGDVHVEEDILFDGHWGATLREALGGLERGHWKELFQQYISADATGAVLARFDVGNAEAVETPLRISLAYDLEEGFSRAATSLVGRIPATWERAYLATTPTSQRLSPFEVQYPLRLETALTLTAPDGFRVEAGDRGSGIPASGRFLRWTGSARAQPWGLRVRYQAELESGRFPARDYEAFYRETSEALGFFDRPIELLAR